MTIDIGGTDIGQIIETASWVGSLLAMLIAGLVVYLMVRPPRHVRRGRREAPPRALEASEADELWRLVDRMEARLDVLERALGDETGVRRQRFLEPADRGRENGRTK